LADSPDYYETEEYHKLKKYYDRQMWMIVGEGMVFLVLLSIGTFRLWNTFRKEFILARQQNNFLLSITHELKSPLASIKLSLQTFLKRGNLKPNLNQLVDNSLEDVDRLNDLINNILFAAKMESHNYSIIKNEENVSELVNAISKKIAFEHKEVSFKLKIEDNILMECDRQALASAFINLIENAIKYSSNELNIEVKLYETEKLVIFEVIDEGIGIPENDMENVFKKFYRVGSEETRKTKGTGLGLYIVKRAVDMHQGKIFVMTNKPKGTIMQLKFPILEATNNIHLNLLT